MLKPKTNLFFFFIEGILNIVGANFIGIGLKKEVAKPIKVSLIKWYWVFLYTAQKEAI